MSILKKFLILFAAALMFSTFTFETTHFASANPPAKPANAANDFKTYMMHASKAFVAKDYNTAIINFKKAIEINPNSYEAYCVLGMSYGYLGKVKEAEETLILATKKFPNEWVAYTFLGDIKHQLGQTPAAVDYYRKALNSPTLPKDKKAGLQKVIQGYINEQNAYEAKSSVPSGEKIKVNLDNNIWKRVYFKGTDKKWMAEYGLKNEDVLNYKWTKLVTVNFYDKNTYNFTAEKIYNSFYTLLTKSADEQNGALKIQRYSSPAGEIYFEWSITGRGESEICRIFSGSRGLYFGHYAHKKDSFTETEKANAINILKSIKEI